MDDMKLKPFKTLTQLADFLEDMPEERFDMNQGSVPKCGTAGCIGAWVIAANFPGNRSDGFEFGISSPSISLAEAMEQVFGIPYQDADGICYPGAASEVLDEDCYSASSHQAAAMLRHYDKHGDVIEAWREAMAI